MGVNPDAGTTGPGQRRPGLPVSTPRQTTVRTPSATITTEVRWEWKPMRVALVLVVLAGLLTTGCLGGGEPKAAVVTVTQETPANAAEPTPTWQQWLGEQVARGECGDPSNILMYQNVSREPPYSADFFCWTTGSTPNAVATQVAATVAAIPTPTRRPSPTPYPTRQPTSTPYPPPEHMLAEMNPVMATDTAVCEWSGGINRVERLRTEPSTEPNQDWQG